MSTSGFFITFGINQSVLAFQKMFAHIGSLVSSTMTLPIRPIISLNLVLLALDAADTITLFSFSDVYPLSFL